MQEMQSENAAQKLALIEQKREIQLLKVLIVSILETQAIMSTTWHPSNALEYILLSGIAGQK